MLASFSAPSLAQESEESAIEGKKAEAVEALAEILTGEPAAEFKDPLGRETPRSSARGFMLAGENGDFGTAANFMDFRNLPLNMRDLDPVELAEQLYLVISRTVWIYDTELSDDPLGAKDDGLPGYRDRSAVIDLDGEEVMLLLQRVPSDEPGQFIWKWSNVTVADIPALYEHYGYAEWIEEFRKKVPSGTSFLGLELFKWILMAATIFLLWPVLWLLFYGLTRLVSSPDAGLYPEIKNLLTRPLPILIVLIFNRYLLMELGLGATAQKIVGSNTLPTIMTVWFLFCLIDLVRGVRRERFIAKGRNDAAVLGRPMANALKLLIILMAILVWLSNIGVEISALLAGLGVGGIAVALALQKPIEDLFGAVTIYSQRPVATGDVCRYGNHFGTVEEIGLRSTRIRTPGNTVVSVPNSRLAYEDIENISARKSVWYKPLIRLRIDTTPDQMREVVNRVRQLLVDDERVLDDVLRVQFRQFGEYSLDIQVHCYIDTTRFDEYLKIAEELNFRILEIVHDSGAHLALPERGGRFQHVG